MPGTYLSFVATYPDVSSAEGDFQAVRNVYDAGGLVDTFDGVVIGKKADGTARLYTKQGPPRGPASWLGAGWGLATGLAVVLFPAIGIGAAGWTASTGAGLSAIAGHVSRGMSRKDLSVLGTILDSGLAALIVVAGSELGGAVDRAIEHAIRRAALPLRADWADLIRELNDVRTAVAATG